MVFTSVKVRWLMQLLREIITFPSIFIIYTRAGLLNQIKCISGNVHIEIEWISFNLSKNTIKSSLSNPWNTQGQMTQLSSEIITLISSFNIIPRQGFVITWCILQNKYMLIIWVSLNIQKRGKIIVKKNY